MHFGAYFVIYYYINLVTFTALIINYIEKTVQGYDKSCQYSSLFSMLTDFKKCAHLGAFFTNLSIWINLSLISMDIYKRSVNITRIPVLLWTYIGMIVLLQQVCEILRSIWAAWRTAGRPPCAPLRTLVPRLQTMAGNNTVQSWDNQTKVSFYWK